jgi:hypothetical protein
MKQIKIECWILFEDLFNKFNIFYRCSNDIFFNVFWKHQSLTNFNMLICDFSTSNFIHCVIEQNKLHK